MPEILTVPNVRLNDAFMLPHRIAVYVPSTDNAAGRASAYDNADLVHEVMMQFCTLFGGATVTRGIGGWVDTAGLVTEDVAIVASSCPNLNDLDAAIDIAIGIKRLLSQDAVTMEVDGRLYLI